MSAQTQAIRARLGELVAEANKLKVQRNDAIVAIASNPRDADASKRLAALSTQLPGIEDEMAAYESALDHALVQDRFDKREAAATARRQSVETAVRCCEALAPLDAEIAALTANLDEVISRRASVKRGCIAAALQIVTLRGADGNLAVYENNTQVIATHAATNDPARLRECLELFCDRADQRDGIEQGLT